jgi:hypothetical protein
MNSEAIENYVKAIEIARKLIKEAPEQKEDAIRLALDWEEALLRATAPK